MQALQLHADQATTTTQAHSAPCSYPLETIMALQKRLESGIPEHIADQSSRPPLSMTTRQQARSAPVSNLYDRMLNACRKFAQEIGDLFMRRAGAKSEKNIGSSAQQRG